MKRKALYLIAAVLTICLLLCGCFRRMPNPDLPEVSDSEKNDLVITASDVDDTANNRAANKNGFAAQIGDKLYVAAENIDRYYLCEVATGTTRILREDDNSDFNNMMWDNNTLMLYDGMLCMPRTGFVQSTFSDRHIDLESGETVDAQTVYFEGAGFWYPILSDGILYYCDYSTLGCYENGENRTLATAQEMGLSEGEIDDKLYIGGGCAYYTKHDGNTLILNRYDFSKKEITGSVKVVELKEDSTLWNIIADGDDAYCFENNKLYHVDFAENTCEVIFSCDDQYGMMFNYYDKKLYIGVNDINDDTEPGLYLLDTAAPEKEAELLVKDETVDGVYIFDDEYVYYSASFDRLSRVRLSDKTTELVFDYCGDLVRSDVYNDMDVYVEDVEENKEGSI